MAEIDLELVRHALTVARSRGFAEVNLAAGDDTFTATLTPAPKSGSKKASKAESAGEQPLVEIKSSLVGYYQLARVPLEIGKKVKKGDVIAVVVALGIANDVESKSAGEVVEILVEANQALEYGQVIARLKPE